MKNSIKDCLSKITKLPLVELVNTLSSLNDCNRVYINPIDEISYCNNDEEGTCYHGKGILLHTECNELNINIDIIKPVSEILDIESDELFILHVYEEVCSLIGGFKYNMEKMSARDFFLYHIMDDEKTYDNEHNVFYIISQDINSFNEDEFVTEVK